MNATLYLLAAYGTALAAAVLTVLAFGWIWGGTSFGEWGYHHLIAGLAADVVATIVVFGFSQAARNSSVYDPYWSVAPPLLLAYWIITAGEVPVERVLVALAITCVWAWQLTRNWALRWRGLADEDWRYSDIRRRSGRWFPLSDLFGIQMMPTLLVFGGMVPLYHATRATAPLNVIDMLALIVVVVAIAIEMTADSQLRTFIKQRAAGIEGIGARLRSGLRAHARHPNYFGEISFWWGIALFGFAASEARAWWLFGGAIAILLLFNFISVPLMNARGLARHDWYRQHMAETRALVPLPRGRQHLVAPALLAAAFAATTLYVLLA